MSGARIAALALVGALAAGCSGGGEGSPPQGVSTPPSLVPGDGPSATPGALPLAGRVVVLDPGHQLGNRHHGAEIARPVDAGGFDKECNTTGAATASDYPEATFTWQVAVATRRILRGLGARVLLTRPSNSDRLWGPCIDQRGRLGNPGERGPTADLRLSIHADGVEAAGARGFHVIRPGVRAGWTDDIARPSRRLAVVVRDALVDAGFGVSTYRGTDGIDVRTDLGTLNHSDVPTVMVELANMRNRADASVLESAQGRQQYATALAEAIGSYLAR